MKLTCQLKLKTNQEEKKVLLQTMKEFNEICNGISEVSFDIKVFKQFNIHNLLYYSLRNTSDLSAQMVVLAISKVADAYKLDQKKLRTFRPRGAITYDDRILSWKENEVSLWTLQGRKKLSYYCGKKQKKLLKFQKGETDLIFRENEFYLYTTCEIPEKEEKLCNEYLGIDLGITNIAADNLGHLYSGNHVNALRKRHVKLRKKLQAKGTKSARKLLKKRGKKEKRFAKNQNHIISKKIVETAQRHSWGISLENLEGIAVVLVDPSYTSQSCFSCGVIEKSNRKSQSVFSCKSCGHTAHADINAACNIASRASCQQAKRVRSSMA